MTNPATNLSLDAFYSIQATDGSSDLYCQFMWTPVDKIDVFYRLMVHYITPAQWVFVQDMPWEAFYLGTAVKFATRPSGSPPPAAIRLIDQIKIETHDYTDDIPANVSSATISTPTTIPTFHDTPNTLTYISFGDLGDTRGRLQIFWKDLSTFIGSGRLTLSKYGLTSPTVKQVLVDYSYQGCPSFRTTQQPPVLRGNFFEFGFDILPPGVRIPDPPEWDPDNPPSPDVNAAKWVVEGDLLTVTIATKTDAGTQTEIIATFHCRYYHKARFLQITDTATVGQPYSKQLQIIQDPWVPGIPIGGTFSMVSAFPPGTGWNLTTSGLLTATSPSTAGDFTLKVRLTSKGNAQSIEPVILDINIAGTPIIKAPAHNMFLVKGLPYKPAYAVYATNHPTSYARTGTLPAGLSFDTATGIISGTPTVEQIVTSTFTATNAVPLTSPTYDVTFTVQSFDTPTITSDAEFTCFLEEAATYHIITDSIAQEYIASGLPAGLLLIGAVIAGTPDDQIGEYDVVLQAHNRWGWGETFKLNIILSIAPPVINSPLSIQAILGDPFTYQIAATHKPKAYSATNLPAGLVINRATGQILGTPTSVGTYNNIVLKAINEGGIGTATLVLTVVLPPVPVIDTTATHGRAITTKTHTYFYFNASASHNPTSWTAEPLPEGLSLSILEGACAITGMFQVGGLYSIVFTATNRGGTSDPATFYFLVTLAEEAAERINQLGTISELWVNLDDGAISVGTGGSEVDEEGVPVLPTATEMTVKRGDSTEVHVIFHEAGIPADVNLFTLKFGLKTAFDEEYVVYNDVFRLVDAGRYRIYPDFSGTNDDLDAVLVNATTKLMGELQWEMMDETNNLVRRSTQIFNVNILRDLIHPD